MRAPRNLDKYTDAETAAQGLEEIAKMLRDRASFNPLVKTDVTLRFWNPEWNKTTVIGTLPPTEKGDESLR